MKRRATFEELSRFLAERSGELRRRLECTDAQFCIPTDGKGLRIQVAVRPGTKVEAPETIDIEAADGSSVEAPLEVTEDYQTYGPLDA